MSTLTGYLDSWAERQPDTLLYAFYDLAGKVSERFTYQQFAERTSVLAQTLRDHGLSRGQHVLLLHPPGLHLITALFACARIGAICAVAPITHISSHRSAATRTRLARMAEDCAPAMALLTSEQLSRSSNLDGVLPENISLLATDNVHAYHEVVPDDPHEVLLLQYTSGSTSNPKGVVVLHKNVIENARFLLDHSPVTVSWLPQFHDMGLIGYYLFPLVLGGTSHCFAPADFIKRPSLWLRMIAMHRATFTSAPNFAFDYCLKPGKISDEEVRSVDLSTLRVLLNGAEPVKPATCRCFAERFTKYGLQPGVLVAAYGLAEATLAVTRGSNETTHFDAELLARGIARPTLPGERRSVELASCGTPLANLRVEIQSIKSGRPLSEGEMGEICLEGSSVTPGYWRLEQQRYGHWDEHTVIADTSTSLLHTNDLGFLYLGHLYICGRLSDLLIKRGMNFHAEDIELAITDPGVREQGRVVFQDSDGTITVLVEPSNPNRLPDPRCIASDVALATGLTPDRVIVVAARSILWTSSGKIARRETQRHLQQGQLTPLLTYSVPQSTDQDTEGTVSWLSDLISHTPELSYTPLSEIGIDSLQLVQLQLELGEDLEICLGTHAAAYIDGPFLQYCNCGQIVHLSRVLRSGDALAAAAFAQTLARTGLQAKTSEQLRMMTDASLTLPIMIEQRQVRVDKLERVLLTGATGFLGPHLLRSLLEQTSLPIYLLVRGNNDDHSRERVIEALQRAQLYTDAINNGFPSRVIIWSGNVAEPTLGLSSDRIEELANSRCAIYHNAAMVNYVRNYDTLRSANVAGTHHILALAMSGAHKELHYISSTFIFGWTTARVLYENDDNGNMANLDFGYSQSKWVAEQLVLRAGSAGLPVVVYRPSLISVASSTYGDPHDIAARLLAFIIKYGVAVDTPNQLSLVPVDVLANNLVAISENVTAHPVTLHLTADRYYSLTDLTRQIGSIFGFTFEYFDIASFIVRLNVLAKPDDPIFPLLDFVNRAAPHMERMSLKRYDNAEYRNARHSAARAVPDPSLKETAQRLVLFLISQNWIKLPSMEGGRVSESAEIARSGQ